MQDTQLQRLQEGELLPTKANIETLAKEIVHRCEEGEADTLKTVVRLNAIKQTCETAIEGLKTVGLSELAKYGKHGAKILSAEVKSMEAGVKYDYSKDAEWRELKATVDAATADLKEREAFLKGITKPFDVIDKDTGETTTIYPPNKSGTTTFKVTLQ